MLCTRPTDYTNISVNNDISSPSWPLVNKNKTKTIFRVPAAAGTRILVGSYVVNRVNTIRLGRTLTLSLRLSQLRLTNLIFVLFLEQLRLRNAERQHPHFGNTSLLSEQSQDFEVCDKSELRCEVVKGGR